MNPRVIGRFVVALVLLSTGILSVIPAHAVASATIYVAPSGSTGDGSSCSAPGFAGANAIQSAINSIPALGADSITIKLCPGTFSPTSLTTIDSTTVSTNGATVQTLVIQSNSADPSNTIVDGSSAGTSGLFVINTYANLEVNGITFQNARNDSGFGGAFEFLLDKINKNFKSSSTYKIHDNLFVANSTGTGGGAIHAMGDDMGAGDFTGLLEIYNNKFYENSVTDDGGAISNNALAFNATRMNIHNNSFAYNTAGRAGGAISVNFAGATIVDNYFYLNSSPNSAHSIYQHGSFTTSGNRIAGPGTASISECSSPDNGSTSTNNWADNAYCNANHSNTATTFTLKTRAEILAATGNFLPQSPSFTTTAGNGSLRLNLSSRGNGGSAITNYEYSLNGGSFSAISPATGDTTTITLSGLTNGTTYGIRLRAITAVGTSLRSSSVNGTPAASVPGAPTIGSARATNATTASVDFTAPGSDGGATITTYYCYSDVGGFQVTLSQAGSGTCNFTGLTDGGTYKFRVRARNSAGNGALSSYSNSITTSASAADTSAQDKAAAQEAERKRQKDIEDARAALIAKVSKGETVIISDVTKANLPAVADKTNIVLNKELQAIPVEQRSNFEAISKVVSKLEILDKLQGNLPGTVSARDLTTYAIIPADTPQKTVVTRKLQELPVEQRDSITEINAFVAAKTQEYQDRLARLAAVKAKIASRQG